MTDKSKYIVITGAGRGIGHQLATLFAASENTRVLAIVRNTKSLDTLLAAYPSCIIPIEYDLENLLLDENALAGLIGQYTTQVDILINNAGLMHKCAFEDATTSEIRHLFDINYVAPALLIRSLMPMLEKASGHVVNIASMAGFQGSLKFGGLSHYSASKAALATLTECLAVEYKTSKVRFNALALGAVQTEMLKEAFPGLQAPLNATQMASFIVNFAYTGHQFFNGKVLPVSLSTI